MTMSASLPGWITPLRGYRPNIRAGVAAEISTQRGSEISPAATPWCSRSIRCSTPGIPFGILEKSPRPSSFCSRKQNGQWSVDTTDRSLVRSPCQSVCWCGGRRSGGEATYLAPSKSGLARSSRDRYRYCGQVSAKTFCPASLAWVTAASAWIADRCTMYSGQRATWARVMAREVASPSSSGGRVRPCCTGSGGGLEAVRRERPAERHLHVRVGVDAARQQVLPGRVDDPVRAARPGAGLPAAGGLGAEPFGRIVPGGHGSHLLAVHQHVGG